VKTYEGHQIGGLARPNRRAATGRICAELRDAAVGLLEVVPLLAARAGAPLHQPWAAPDEGDVVNRQQRRAVAKRYPKQMRREIADALKPQPAPTVQELTEERARGLGIVVVKAKELLGMGGEA